MSYRGKEETIIILEMNSDGKIIRLSFLQYFVTDIDMKVQSPLYRFSDKRSNFQHH